MPITKIMGSPKLHLHTLSNRSINRIAEVAIIQIGAISIIDFRNTPFYQKLWKETGATKAETGGLHHSL